MTKNKETKTARQAALQVIVDAANKETRGAWRQGAQQTLKNMLDAGLIELVDGRYRVTKLGERLDEDQVTALLDPLDDESDTRH